MADRIVAKPLTAEDFAPYGDVIQKTGTSHFPINNGRCMRYHDLAAIEAEGPGARAIISVAASEPYALPLRLDMVERHPLGSQAFVPLTTPSFLVVVCPDVDGVPGRPEAFVTAGGQGVNYRRNTWHGVLTPLDEPAEFLIVDRAGEGVNLEEFFFKDPYEITLTESG